MTEMFVPPNVSIEVLNENQIFQLILNHQKAFPWEIGNEMLQSCDM